MRRFRNIKPNYIIFTLSQDISEILTAGNRLFKSTKNDYKNELNMFTCFGLFFEILNLLKIIYFNSDKM